jgi:hypothetical protein
VTLLLIVDLKPRGQAPARVSINNLQSAIFNRQSSIGNHQSAIINQQLTVGSR